jgi:hypothetical protein
MCVCVCVCVCVCIHVYVMYERMCVCVCVCVYVCVYIHIQIQDFLLKTEITEEGKKIWRDPTSKTDATFCFTERQVCKKTPSTVPKET